MDAKSRLSDILRERRPGFLKGYPIICASFIDSHRDILSLHSSPYGSYFIFRHDRQLGWEISNMAFEMAQEATSVYMSLIARDAASAPV